MGPPPALTVTPNMLLGLKVLLMLLESCTSNTTRQCRRDAWKRTTVSNEMEINIVPPVQWLAFASSSYLVKQLDLTLGSARWHAPVPQPPPDQRERREG